MAELNDELFNSLTPISMVQLGADLRYFYLIDADKNAYKVDMVLMEHMNTHIQNMKKPQVIKTLNFEDKGCLGCG